MMLEKHRGTGKIVYDPRRGDMKSATNWWCVIDVDKEITRYYRWWLQRERHIILQKPAWDAHISIVRGERACSKVPHVWNKYQGQKIEFSYEHGDIQMSKDVDQPGYFYWIRVDCPFVDQMRQELGLPTSWKYHHLTIGRTYY